MNKQYSVVFKNRDIVRQVTEGTLLESIIREVEPGFVFPCNGRGSCGKCRVRAEGELTPPTSTEIRHLGSAALAAGVRLACQAKVIGPVQVKLPEMISGEAILSAGYLRSQAPDPLWSRVRLEKPEPLTWEAIASVLPADCRPSLNVLREIPRLPRETPELSLDILNGQVIGVTAGSDPGACYAVAVDIGTTTLAAYLVNLATAGIERTVSAFNPQGSYGADLISRISHAATTEGLEELHRAVIAAVNRFVVELACAAGIHLSQIIQVNLAGNSCMSQLFLKVDPESLGRLPFEPVVKDLVRMTPAELGLTINADGLVYVLPGIGGFIGSDISAGALACELNGDKTELFIDIGTNGEIILTGKGRMLASSTAAGPAFEGAKISCGRLAGPGAVADLQFTPAGLELVTIGNQPPSGICGTGLIRAVVELVKRGIIEETGRFADGLSDPRYDPEQKRYYLTERNVSDQEVEPVYISQQDIRQFQLAKGAVYAGIHLLMKKLGLKPEDLSTVYLAGAFGSYLKPEDAVFLGLLPPVPLDRIKAVGNTAGMGTVITVLSQTALEDLRLLTRRIEHVELANDPEFTEIFTEAMMFRDSD
ncbi:MAG TPA: ASKHA domain-containing protein [Bacillota bacterium]